mgnify:CR=1 FL=1
MPNKYFPEITSPIPYEGPDSDNPLAFQYYDAERDVDGKSMADHLRFAVAFWHTFRGTGADMFGGGVWERPWRDYDAPLDRAKATMDAAFEFFQKLGVHYYCFHDVDIAPEGKTFADRRKHLQIMVDHARTLQDETGIRLLWGTANLFGNPIYTHGAASNPDAHVFAHAAAQVKNALDATKELGGENYVFWGGREGYSTLLNTHYSQEQEQLARFFHMAVDYAEKIGFDGQLLIEPKPAEPTKHQYDYNASTILNFLRKYDLLDHFQLNIEANHATLAGHTFQHELTVASAEGKLGSIDANRGDLMLGWDTDQFPTDIYSTTFAMLVVLQQGGLAPGGLNFDAKLRRGSIDLTDMFYAHIGGMDAFARGLIIADEIIRDGRFSDFIEERYSGFRQGVGKRIMEGEATLEELEEYILDHGKPGLVSGRQEMLENLVNQYIR